LSIITVLVTLTVPVVLTAFDSVVYVSGNDMGKNDFKSSLQSISCPERQIE